MPEYTYRRDGIEFSFNWNSFQDPTEEDLDEIFNESQLMLYQQEQPAGFKDIETPIPEIPPVPEVEPESIDDIIARDKLGVDEMFSLPYPQGVRIGPPVKRELDMSMETPEMPPIYEQPGDITAQYRPELRDYPTAPPQPQLVAPPEHQEITKQIEIEQPETVTPLQAEDDPWIVKMAPLLKKGAIPTVLGIDTDPTPLKKQMSAVKLAESASLKRMQKGFLGEAGDFETVEGYKPGTREYQKSLEDETNKAREILLARFGGDLSTEGYQSFDYGKDLPTASSVENEVGYLIKAAHPDNPEAQKKLFGQVMLHLGRWNADRLKGEAEEALTEAEEYYPMDRRIKDFFDEIEPLTQDKSTWRAEEFIKRWRTADVQNEHFRQLAWLMYANPEKAAELSKVNSILINQIRDNRAEFDVVTDYIAQMVETLQPMIETGAKQFAADMTGVPGLRQAIGVYDWAPLIQGQIFQQLVDQGLDADSAANAAFTYGTLSAAIELVQVQGFGQGGKEAYKSAIKNLVTNPTIQKRIINFAKNFGKDLVQETTEELAQNWVENFGMKLEQDPNANVIDVAVETLDETMQQSLQTAGDMAFIQLVTKGAGGTIGGVKGYADTRKGKIDPKIAAEIEKEKTKETFKEIEKQIEKEEKGEIELTSTQKKLKEQEKKWDELPADKKEQLLKKQDEYRKKLTEVDIEDLKKAPEKKVEPKPIEKPKIEVPVIKEKSDIEKKMVDPDLTITEVEKLEKNYKKEFPGEKEYNAKMSQYYMSLPEPDKKTKKIITEYHKESEERIDYFKTPVMTGATYETGLEGPEAYELVKNIFEEYDKIKVVDVIDKDNSIKGVFIFSPKKDRRELQIRRDLFIGPEYFRKKVTKKNKDSVENAVIKDMVESGIKPSEIISTYKNDQLAVYKKDPNYFRSILAHEIGHAISNYASKEVGGKSSDRGNLLARVASLIDYREETLPKAPELSNEEKLKLQVKARTDLIEETGIIPTIDDINARYKEMLKKNKDLLFNTKMRRELIKLSASWNPFNPKKVSKKYLEYRTQSEELYADAISVLLNNPKLLKEKAPNFYEGFFNYLDRKPAVKSSYQEIISRIKKGGDALYTYRNEQEMLKTKEIEQKIIKKTEEIKKEIEKVDEPATTSFLEEYYDDTISLRKAEKRVEKATKKKIPFKDKPSVLLEEYSMRAAMVENFIHDLTTEMRNVLSNELSDAMNLEDAEAFLTQNLKLKRIASFEGKPGERMKTPQDAKKQIEALKNTVNAIGEENGIQNAWKSIDKATNNFYDIWKKHVADRLVKSGMWSEALVDEIKKNKNYVRTVHEEYAVPSKKNRSTKMLTTQIFGYKGDIGDVSDVLYESVAYGGSLIEAVKRNKTVKGIVDFYQKYEPHKIKKTPIDPKTGQFDTMRDSQWSTVAYLEDGKYHAYDIPRVIADKINNINIAAHNKGTKAIISFGNIQKKIHTQWNPGWLLRNPMIDIGTAVQNLPVPMIWARMLPQWFSAFRRAYDYVVKQKKVPTIQEMMNLGAMVPGRIWTSNEVTPESRMNKLFEEFKFYEREVKSPLKRGLKKLENFIETVGELGEKTTKIASYELLKKHRKDLTDSERAYMVRNWAGTPNPYRAGTLKMLYNNIFIFSNINKEAWRANFESMKYDPVAWWGKYTAINGLQKALWWAAGKGLLSFLGPFGDWLEKFTKLVPADHFDRYYVVPITIRGEGINEEADYLTIPKPGIQKILDGMLRMSLDFAEKDSPLDVYQMLNHIYSENPYGSNSPVAQNVSLLLAYMSGENPENFFGREVVDREDMSQLYPTVGGTSSVIKQAFKNFGSDNYFTIPDVLLEQMGKAVGKQDVLYKDTDWTDFIRQTPVLGKMISGYWKTSNRGIAEKVNKYMKIQGENRRRFEKENQKILNEFVNTHPDMTVNDIRELWKKVNEYRLNNKHRKNLKPIPFGTFGKSLKKLLAYKKGKTVISSVSRAKSRQELNDIVDILALEYGWSEEEIKNMRHTSTQLWELIKGK